MGLAQRYADRFDRFVICDTPGQSTLATAAQWETRIASATKGGMQAELESHMAKEEQVLFPLMRNGGHPMITHPIAMMRHEHDTAGEDLSAVTALTRDMTPPQGACNSWRALYAGLAKFAEDLTEHVHIENNILFPRFEG